MVADVVSRQLLKLKFIDDFMKSLLNRVNFMYFSNRMRRYVYQIPFSVHSDVLFPITEIPVALSILRDLGLARSYFS